MSAKYYMARNAGQLVAGLKFEVYDIIGGSPFGVLRTEDPEVIKTLEAAIAGGKSTVNSITESEYMNCLKKKPLRFEGFSNLRQDLTSPEPVAIKGQGAVIVSKPESDAAPESSPVEVSQVESAEKAVTVGRRASQKKNQTQEPDDERKVDLHQ